MYSDTEYNKKRFPMEKLLGFFYGGEILLGNDEEFDY